MSSLEELVNEQEYLEPKLKKIKAKIRKHNDFIDKVEAALNSGLGVSGSAVGKCMELKENSLPLLISRGNQMIERLRVLREEIPRLRQQERCKELKEDIIAAAFHPKRVEKWLEQGGFELLESI